MAGIMDSIFNLHKLDDFSHRDSFVHRIHPVANLICTFLFIITVVSFNKYEIIALLPLFLYPVVLFALSDIPVTPIIKRLLYIEPIIIGIGILNPLFDNVQVSFAGVMITRGWITFLSIMIKSILTITASLLLLATTGMDRIAAALRFLRIPRLFVLQILLTYRYISVLAEEAALVSRAYFLRAPTHKGIRRNAWGPLAGQLLLRAAGRAQRVYQAMLLRGFTGEYKINTKRKLISQRFIDQRFIDAAYILVLAVFLIAVRSIDIPQFLGHIFKG